MTICTDRYAVRIHEWWLRPKSTRYQVIDNQTGAVVETCSTPSEASERAANRNRQYHSARAATIAANDAVWAGRR